MATEANAIVANVRSQLQVNECPIAKLADEDLAAIFKCLPPFERLIVSQVSTKWRDISQTPWRDVTHLDLSQVPMAHIHAVIKKCPNLASVSAMRQNLGDLGRFVSRLGNIASLKCVDCTFTFGLTAPLTNLRESIRSASWNELIWHNSKTVVMRSGMPWREYPLPYANAHALRRLQMSAVRRRSEDNVASANIAVALDELPQLESCIVADVVNSVEEDVFAQSWFSRRVCLLLANSTSLRELYLDWPHYFSLKRLMSTLPQLKLLYLNNVNFRRTDISGLLTLHASLCVLVITATHVSDHDGTIVIPVRKLFPNGFNAPPVPPLHLFLGNIAAEKLRFHPSPSDALKIYPIDAPLPEFLEKEEIKPMFEGSWIASRIKDGVKEGVNLADYSFEGNAESISYVQE